MSSIPSSFSTPLLIAALALGAAGAGACGKEANAPRITDSVAQQRPAPVPASAPAADIAMLEFSPAALPRDYTYTGDIVGGARWRDGNGENTLIVSHTFSRPKPDGEEERREEIFGYLYLNDAGSTRLLWKIQDNADNYCDNGDGLVSKIKVADVDGDGIAENAFIYNIQGTCDVSPRTFKLMMHSGDRKFAIRGTNTVDPGGDPSGSRIEGEKNFDASFDGAPKGFREFAGKLWDDTLPGFYIGP